MYCSSIIRETSFKLFNVNLLDSRRLKSSTCDAGTGKSFGVRSKTRAVLEGSRSVQTCRQATWRPHHATPTSAPLLWRSLRRCCPPAVVPRVRDGACAVWRADLRAAQTRRRRKTLSVGTSDCLGFALTLNPGNERHKVKAEALTAMKTLYATFNNVTLW